MSFDSRKCVRGLWKKHREMISLRVASEMQTIIGSLELVQDIRRLTARAVKIQGPLHTRITSLIPGEHFVDHLVICAETEATLECRIDLCPSLKYFRRTRTKVADGVSPTAKQILNAARDATVSPSAIRSAKQSRMASRSSKRKPSLTKRKLRYETKRRVPATVRFGSMHFVPFLHGGLCSGAKGYEAQSVWLTGHVTYPQCVASVLVKVALALGFHAAVEFKKKRPTMGAVQQETAALEGRIEVYGMGGNSVCLALDAALRCGVLPWLRGATTTVVEVEPAIVRTCQTHNLCGEATCIVKDAFSAMNAASNSHTGGGRCVHAHRHSRMGGTPPFPLLIVVDCFDPSETTMIHPEMFLRHCRRDLKEALTLQRAPVAVLIVNTHANISRRVEDEAAISPFCRVFSDRQKEEVHAFPLPKLRQAMVACLIYGDAEPDAANQRFFPWHATPTLSSLTEAVKQLDELLDAGNSPLRLSGWCAELSSSCRVHCRKTGGEFRLWLHS